MIIGTYGEEHYVRWLHWVLIGQTDETVVYTTLKVCRWRPSNGEMPLKGFVLERLSIDEYLLLSFDVSVFLHDSAHGQR